MSFTDHPSSSFDTLVLCYGHAAVQPWWVDWVIARRASVNQQWQWRRGAWRDICLPYCSSV